MADLTVTCSCGKVHKANTADLTEPPPGKEWHLHSVHTDERPECETWVSSRSDKKRIGLIDRG